MSKRLLVLVILITALGECFWTRLQAQGQCDPSLTLVTASAVGYRDRGDRCEGLYIKQVSSTTLFVASFTEVFGEYDINSGKALVIEWDKPPYKNAIHLRAQGVRHKLYYRMDTYRPIGSSSYLWASDLLASLKILKKDIGVIGTTRVLIGKEERDLYLPLRITSQGSAARTGSYKLLLLPGVELSEIYISLAPVGPDGRQAKFIRNGEKLGYGYYPAERGVEIPISGMKGIGIYYLEIGATLKSGGSSTVEIWFYHSK